MTISCRNSLFTLVNSMQVNPLLYLLHFIMSRVIYCDKKKNLVCIHKNFKYRWILLVSSICVLNASTDNKSQHFKFVLLDSL